MKKVTYKTTDGKDLVIEYDETAPCIICGLPVEAASMGGTSLCPWCDCGNYRNGEKISLEELNNRELLKVKVKKIAEKNREDWEKIKYLIGDQERGG